MNSVTPIGKIALGQTGSVALIGIGYSVMCGTIDMSMKKIATYSVSGPQETSKTAKLATISMYGVSKGQ